MKVSGPSLVGGRALLLSRPMTFQLIGSMQSVGGVTWLQLCACARPAANTNITAETSAILRSILTPWRLDLGGRRFPSGRRRDSLSTCSLGPDRQKACFFRSVRRKLRGMGGYGQG